MHLGTQCQGRPYLPWHQKSVIRKGTKDRTQSYASVLCNLLGTDTTIQTVFARPRLPQVHPVLQCALRLRAEPRLTVFPIHHAWYKDTPIWVSDHLGTFVKSPLKKQCPESSMCINQSCPVTKLDHSESYSCICDSLVDPPITPKVKHRMATTVPYLSAVIYICEQFFCWPFVMDLFQGNLTDFCTWCPHLTDFNPLSWLGHNLP
jgi:hypothetical protein